MFLRVGWSARAGARRVAVVPPSLLQRAARASLFLSPFLSHTGGISGFLGYWVGITTILVAVSDRAIGMNFVKSFDRLVATLFATALGIFVR